jgi:hypothetical protein
MTVLKDGENPTYPVAACEHVLVIMSGIVPTKLSDTSIPTGRHGLEVRIRVAIGYKNNS